ncbi:MAG: OPT/YSL family transporter [Polyangiaceae bacterium]|nr:OPT/YSL family transporter [Polyangiaceae bacterium]
MSSDTPEQSDAEFPLSQEPLRDPAAVAARDREWLEKVYRRGEAQLTFRAVASGMILGALLSASNLYLGLKIGWIFGMSITSAILSFAIFRAASGALPGVRPLTMLETNTSQTAASAAAYMCGAGLVSSFPALTMLRADGTIPASTPMLDGWRMALWLLGTSLLGVLLAVPMKRSLINAEQLKFPSGTVCAETIRTLHAAGKGGVEKARALLYAGVFAAAWKFLFDCKLSFLAKLPEVIAMPGTLRALPLSAFSFQINTSFLLYTAGAVIGLKVATSLALGAIVNYAGLLPWLLDHGAMVIAPPEIARDKAAWAAFDAAAAAEHVIAVKSAAGLAAAMRAKWSVWPGTALMVASSLTGFAFRWRTVLRAFSGLGRVFGVKAAADPLEAVEVPGAWFGPGVLVIGALCVAMQRVWFDVPVIMGVASVVAAFALCVVAARATGETDVTPIGAMGKITQLLFGGLVPGNAAANLMTATVTAGSITHAADMLQEVKTGYLLGGSPRKQFIAQLFGVLAGGLVCVPVYSLIAKPEKIGNELAAPAAFAWMGVAKLLKDGVDNLPRYALVALAVGAGVGVALAVAEELLPKAAKAWLPSATGVGIALVIDANDSLAMFAGAVVAWAFARWRRDLADRFTISVASGAIAGEGLMGILVIALRDVLHWLPPG